MPPAEILDTGDRMIEPLLRRIAKARAAGLTPELCASGIYQHAIRNDNPPGMVAAMLAAALMQLYQAQVSR